MLGAFALLGKSLAKRLLLSGHMERNRPFDSKESAQAIDDLSEEVNEWVDSLDLQQLTRKVQDFGKEKPVILAIAALTVGVAAGLLMKNRSQLN